MVSRGDDTGSGFLTEKLAWNPDNTQSSQTDYRGNQTTFTYDGSKNVQSITLPTTSDSAGSYNTTYIFQHDAYHNVTTYCDPKLVRAYGCTLYHSYVYSYTYPQYEPYGELTNIQDPSGYSTRISYDYRSQNLNGGYQTDYGLPTQYFSSSFSQTDGSTITPFVGLAWSPYGMLSGYSDGVGQWDVLYDALNRPIQSIDPDGVSAYTYYTPNGLVQRTETAYQHATSLGSATTYDADGDVTTNTKHYNNLAGVTQNWYDGLDRILETSQPSDSSDFYGTNWLSRFVYDLTQNVGSVSIGSVTGLHAHGALYKIQEYLPNSCSVQSTNLPANGWMDTQGASFDSFDRQTAYFAPCTNVSALYTETYDQNGFAGQLTSEKDVLGAVKAYSYDPLGNEKAVNYQGEGGLDANVSYQFDADGRPSSMTSSKLGTRSYLYDDVGRLTNLTEESAAVLSSPAVQMYAYYPNGWRKSLSVYSPVYTASPLFNYTYWRDGLRASLAETYPGASGTFTFSYTNAGRPMQMTDPITYVKGSVPTTWAYDSFGRLASYKMPDSDTILYSYDAEGLPVGAAGSDGYTSANSFNIRGEQYAQHLAAPISLNANHSTFRGFSFDASLRYFEAASAHGMLVPHYTSTGLPLNPNNPLVTFNPADGFLKSTTMALGGTTQNGNQWTGTYATSYNPDSLGRLVSKSETLSINSPPFPTRTSKGTLISTYDAEDRVTKVVGTNYNVADTVPVFCDSKQCSPLGSINFSSSYLWGPDNTLDQMSGETLHRDGSGILMTTTSAGALDDVKIERFGDILPKISPYPALSINEFDRAGVIVNAHSAAISTDLGFDLSEDPYFSSGVSSLPYVDSAITEPSIGSMFDAKIAVEGVRVYDPQVQGWATRDSSPGSIDDPFSLRPYVHDRNDPLDFADPSGAAPGPISSLNDGPPFPDPLLGPSFGGLPLLFYNNDDDKRGGGYHRATSSRQQYRCDCWADEINPVDIALLLIIPEVEGPVELYEIGRYARLATRAKGQGFHIHHFVQSAPAKELLTGFSHEKGISIVLGKVQHTRFVRHLQGKFAGTAQEALEHGVQAMRSAGVPETKIEELVRLNKLEYPGAFDE